MSIKMFKIATLFVFILAFIGCGGGDEAKLVGKWVAIEGGSFDALELFKDGTGVGDRYSLNWKVENNRFIITSSSIGFAYTYNYEISDSALILTNDNGRSEKYRSNVWLKKQEEKKALEVQKAAEAAEKAKIAITVGKEWVQVDGKNIVKIKKIQEQDSLLIAPLEESIVKLINSKARKSDDIEKIYLNEKTPYNVFNKIIATVNRSGISNLDFAVENAKEKFNIRIEGEDDDLSPPHSGGVVKKQGASGMQSVKTGGNYKYKGDNYLNLTIVISENYIEIFARGGSLPKLFYKEQSVNSKTELWALNKDTDEIKYAVYSKSDSVYLDRYGEFITELSRCEIGSIATTLVESSARRLACGRTAPGVEDICTDGKPAITLKPLSVFDELAKTLIMIHNRFIDSPDADDIIVIAYDNIAFEKIIGVMNRAKNAGFINFKFAKSTEFDKVIEKSKSDAKK